MKKFKTKQKSNRSGFTLVELVIVIAIVIILSVISVPIYRGYVDKSKMAEGYALLGTILSAQKAYYSEHGNFLRDLESSAKGFDMPLETILGIDARGNKYFTAFTVGTSCGTPNKYFHASARIPEDLQSKGKKRLYIVYNITKGIKNQEVNGWTEFDEETSSFVE